jgi:hypothetical protein
LSVHYYYCQFIIDIIFVSLLLLLLVSLNILLAHDVEYVGKLYHKLLTTDRAALQMLGYDLTDENIMQDIDDDFDRMTNIMKTNQDIQEMYSTYGDNYITGYYLRKYEFLSTDDIEPTDPVTSRKRNTQKKLYMCYYYISTELDLSQNTFKDSISTKHYVENECWINTLYDFYGDNLLSQDKKRNVITRDIILETLGRTEDNIKEGLSISEILTFFL